MGYKNIFKVLISRINPEKAPYLPISIVIKIREK